MKENNITIEKFISDFKKFDSGKEIVDCFSLGYCYWFSYILKGRFPKGEIYYDPVENHFIFKYNDCLYDISGNCTSNHSYDIISKWDDYCKDQSGSGHLRNLIKCCIDKSGA